ncbi:hypothetical protein D3C73_1555200 [compost metagenome]
MAINRTQILETQLFEQNTGHHHVFETIFQLLGSFGKLAANRWYFLQKLFHFVLGSQIIAIRTNFG